MPLIMYLLVTLLVAAAAASDYFLDLVGEQGFDAVGTIAQPPFSIFRPATADAKQHHLCHVVRGSTSAPADEKKHVHDTNVRTILDDGTNVPISPKNPLLRLPTSYTLVFDASDFSTWLPVCPEGFHSVGQVGSINSLPPALDEIVCIKDDCLAPCSPDTMLSNITTAGGATVASAAWNVSTNSDTIYISGCNRVVPFNDHTPLLNSFYCLRKSCLRFDPYKEEVGEVDVVEEVEEVEDVETDVMVDQVFPPFGVHLALGYDATSMSVGWQTFENVTTPLTNSIVEWALSPDWIGHAGTSFAIGDVRAFVADANRTWYTHMAVMSSLQPSTRYYYRVGSNITTSNSNVTSTNTSQWWSNIFTFESAADAKTVRERLPQKHVIIGDLGSACAFSMCPACNCSSPVCDATKCRSHSSSHSSSQASLKATGLLGGLVLAALDADMILHVGDYGYNMDDDDGKIGNQFFQNIEQLAAYVPYMTSIGNHEDGATALAHYTEGFRQMPTTSGTVPLKNVVGGEAPNTWFYSWDAGLVHYVAMSTEIVFGISGDGPDLQGAQYEWIAKDLKRANQNRDNVPWVVVHGHRSVYCSCDGDCDESAQDLRDGPFFNKTNGKNRTWSYEDLFFDHGVDLFINGHEHDYERNYPTYRSHSDLSNMNPKATVYVVTGAAGCDELHEPFTRPQPPRSAFRSNNFGYSQMIVHNDTHLQFQQIMTDPTFFGKKF